MWWWRSGRPPASVTLALSLDRMVTVGWPGGTDVAFAAVFGALLAATWVWPITLYVDGESDGIDFDEGFFVLLVLLVPSALTVLVFAFVTVAAQAIKRRPLVKSVFNAGQVITSVGVAALVFALLRPSTALGRRLRQRPGRAGGCGVLLRREHRGDGLHPVDARHPVATDRARAASRASCSIIRAAIGIADPDGAVARPRPGVPPGSRAAAAHRALPRFRPVLRHARPGPAARALRGDARREPLDGQ